jgi:hypothetical protein
MKNVKAQETNKNKHCRQEGLVDISDSKSEVFLTNKSSIEGSNINSDSSTQPLRLRKQRNTRL